MIQPSLEAASQRFREHGIYGPAFKLFLAAIILQIFVYAAIVVRFYSHKLSKRGFGVDDWCISIAVVFDTVMTGVTIIDVWYGYGNTKDFLANNDRIVALQLFWVSQIIYKVVIGAAKLSFLFFFLRIFERAAHWPRIVTIGTIVLVASYSVASIITTIAQCVPISRVWDKTVSGGCIDLTSFWFSNAVYSIATDIMIIGIPVYTCSKLRTSVRNKIGLGLVFSVGIFVLITSVCRVTTLNIASKSFDQISGTLNSTFWTTVEANTALIVACLPSFKLPLKTLWKRLFSSTAPSQTGSMATGAAVLNRPESRYVSGMNRIAVRTDLDVEFEDKSRESSMTLMIGRHHTNIEAREMA